MRHGAGRPFVALIGILAKRIEAKIPREAVEPGARRQPDWRRRPVERQCAIRGRRRLLTELVVRGRVERRIRVAHMIVARVMTNQLPRRVDDVEGHRR